MKASKRVLMTADTIDGLWRYAVMLAGALAHRDWQVLLAAFGPAPDDGQRAQIEVLDGVKLVAAELPLDGAGADRRSMEAAAATLAEIARRESCDLVHLNTPMLAAAGNWPVPVIGVAHGCLSTWRAGARAGKRDDDMAWRRQMMLEGLVACDRLIAPTLAFADELASACAVDRPIEVVYNGTLPHLPAGLEHGAPFAFTAGRLWDEVENIALLDGVAARLQEPFIAAGTSKGARGQQARFDHLRVLGQLSERAIRAHLARRPVFVSAAVFEPFSLAVLEAAHAGCPLVLSDIASFHELWGGAATFIDAGDEDGYVEAIETLLRDADLRHRLGNAARCRAMDYSVKAMADAMVTQYEGVLKERQSARGLPSCVD